MALPFGDRIRQRLSWPMLRILGEAIGIPSRLAANVLHEQTAAADIWIGELDQLPFDANSIRKLQRLARARVGRIQPDRQQRARERARQIANHQWETHRHVLC